MSSYWVYYNFLRFYISFSSFCCKQQQMLPFFSNSFLPFQYSPDIELVGTEGSLSPRRASSEPALPISLWSPFFFSVSLCAPYLIAAVASQQSARAPSFTCQHVGRVSARYGKGTVFPRLQSCFPSLVWATFPSAMTHTVILYLYLYMGSEVTALHGLYMEEQHLLIREMRWPADFKRKTTNV